MRVVVVTSEICFCGDVFCVFIAYVGGCLIQFMFVSAMMGVACI